MKRKKTVAGISLLGLLLTGIAGLWIAGPPPLESGVYVQCVTSTAAVVAKIDPMPRRLTLEIQENGVPNTQRRVVEDVATDVHAIAVDGLRANIRYVYTLRVTGEPAGLPVGAGEFCTAPASDTVPVRFAALGDTGQLPWWHNMHRMGWSRIRPALAWTQTTQQWAVASWIDAEPLHFFVHLGDIVYWRQIRAAHEEAFFLPFAGLLRDTPLYTMVGNHDLPRDGSAPPFQELFRNPSPAGVGAPQRNFTATWGPVRLVALDVEADWNREPVRPWFEKTLADATEPWVVVLVHKPCFSVYREEAPQLRDELWPILVTHGVDLVISGDDHHFVRYSPTPPGGPIQMTAGGGGKSLYDVRQDARVAASAKAFGFFLVEVDKLVLRGRVLGAGGKVLDSFSIDRSAGALPTTVPVARRTRIMKLRQ